MPLPLHASPYKGEETEWRPHKSLKSHNCRRKQNSRLLAEIGEGAESAIDQGLPSFPLGPNRLVKGRQQAEIDIAKP